MCVRERRRRRRRVSCVCAFDACARAPSSTSLVSRVVDWFAPVHVRARALGSARRLVVPSRVVCGSSYIERRAGVLCGVV